MLWMLLYLWYNDKKLLHLRKIFKPRKMTINILDIILAIVLVWALISGLRKGLISQASSFVGLLLGVWLAFEFNDKLSEWIGVEVEGIAAYAILFAVGVVVAWFFSRISGWILRGIGLGVVDKIGGALLSVVVYSLVLNLLLGFFRNINTSLHIVEDKVIAESKLVEPIEKISGIVFPYLVEAKDAIMESDSFNRENQKSDKNNEEV
jgi:membrane protein required for colicin V production